MDTRDFVRMTVTIVVPQNKDIRCSKRWLHKDCRESDCFHFFFFVCRGPLLIYLLFSKENYQINTSLQFSGETTERNQKKTTRPSHTTCDPFPLQCPPTRLKWNPEDLTKFPLRSVGLHAVQSMFITLWFLHLWYIKANFTRNMFPFWRRSEGRYAELPPKSITAFLQQNHRFSTLNDGTCVTKSIVISVDFQ